MIDEVLVMLKDKLNNYFKLKADQLEDKVTFVDGSKTDPITFPVNNVVPLLINVEEEKSLRAPNRFEGVVRNGIKTEMNPSIRLNLFVLFISRFTDYQQSLKFLSLIIKYFQRNSVFDQYNTPTLDPSIERLRMELITLPISQQNELWNSLRTTYVPSVLYKVSLIVFNDDESFEVTGETREILTHLSNAEV